MGHGVTVFVRKTTGQKNDLGSVEYTVPGTQCADGRSSAACALETLRAIFLSRIFLSSSSSCLRVPLAAVSCLKASVIWAGDISWTALSRCLALRKADPACLPSLRNGPWQELEIVQSSLVESRCQCRALVQCFLHSTIRIIALVKSVY